MPSCATKATNDQMVGNQVFQEMQAAMTLDYGCTACGLEVVLLLSPYDNGTRGGFVYFL